MGGSQLRLAILCLRGLQWWGLFRLVSLTLGPFFDYFHHQFFGHVANSFRENLDLIEDPISSDHLHIYISLSYVNCT